jgi:hypothetical protein
MACIYLLAGIFLFVKGWYILSPLQNKGLGILFVIYSVFRVYRIYTAVESNKSEDTDTLA